MAAVRKPASGAGEGSEAEEAKVISEPDKVVDFFRSLMGDATTSDVTIEVSGGAKFDAHRAILAARSDEMRKLLEDSATKAKASLKFPKDDVRCWSQILRFAYTNEWDYDSSNVVELRRLAEERGFADFEEVVSAAISKVFLKDSVNAVDIAIGARAKGDEGMVDAAFGAAYRNPSAVFNGASLLRMDAELLRTFCSDDRASGNETVIFRGLLRWAESKLEEKESRDRVPRRPDAPATSKPTERWAAWLGTTRDAEKPATLPLVYVGARIRAELGDAIRAVRFPLMDPRMLAEEVMPSGVLSDDELAELLTYAVTPVDARPPLRAVAGFSTAKRKPILQQLRIIMWGAGGASGRYNNSGRGGAGGYLRVRYDLSPGETLMFYVGETGYADQSESVRTTQAWPNGGRGGYNWKTGGGGGATYFTSDKRAGEVCAGAGGGGGGSAGQSYSSGGGGGGGTRDGKVGAGGDAEASGNSDNREGRDGNGDGGRNDSSGAHTDGTHAHGAGGKSGAGGTRSNGGNGGSCSHKHATMEEIINATSHEAIKCPITGESAGEGAYEGEHGGNQKRGKDGLIIVINTNTGARKTFKCTKTPQKFSFGES